MNKLRLALAILKQSPKVDSLVFFVPTCNSQKWVNFFIIIVIYQQNFRWIFFHPHGKKKNVRHENKIQ